MARYIITFNGMNDNVVIDSQGHIGTYGDEVLITTQIFLDMDVDSTNSDYVLKRIEDAALEHVQNLYNEQGSTSPVKRIAITGIYKL
ncbi:hypothetical protein ID855_01995 [Xenorhabdus sp. ZM]|uniref:hypothetical protein n=1 Tax=Xenorhabdus szentirmaii TaxID=290112 RepID=UPI001991BAA7|nr:hypothetical protein [Xenorhabdus sp. ZM]MBD2803504.1 hypothetical protein [Xenorhabdus sp. ZM]